MMHEINAASPARHLSPAMEPLKHRLKNASMDFARQHKTWAKKNVDDANAVTNVARPTVNLSSLPSMPSTSHRPRQVPVNSSSRSSNPALVNAVNQLNHNVTRLAGRLDAMDARLKSLEHDVLELQNANAGPSSDDFELEDVTPM